MQKFVLIQAICVVLFISGCKKECADLQIPDIINPKYLKGEILLDIAETTTISTDFNNGFTSYNRWEAGTPFRIYGDINVRNRFFKVRKYSPTLNKMADYFWNIDFAPYFIYEGQTLDSGTTITVYKIIANYGKGEANQSTSSNSVVLSVQGGVPTVIHQNTSSTPNIKPREYFVIKTEIIYKGEGLYDLAYKIDIDDDIKEENEHNNTSNNSVANIDVH